MIGFRLNGRAATFSGDPEMPLLWFLREVADLKGAKYGCGIGQCGACTVHVGDEAARACVTPMSALDGATVATIESLARDDGDLHPVQQAWIDQDVAQCGYCQTGQIMAVVALLRRSPAPTDAEIDRELTNICRCGAYNRIRQAIHLAARRMAEAPLVIGAETK